MTVVNDLRGVVKRASDEDLAKAIEANRGIGDDFSQGLRVGGLAARGQLNKVAGVGMDALGFDGSGRNAAAAEDAAAAAEAGQGMVGLRDIGSVRDALRYAAGTAGSILPTVGAAVGAGLLTGGGAVPAMTAGTAATVPFALGDQLQRQDADPVAAALPAGQRLGAALPAAVGSAALQNFVPAGVAARLAGRGGAATAKQIVGRALADVPANAVASAGAEGVRQLGDQAANPEARVNPDAILDAGIEGAGVGVLFGGVGALGHAAGSLGGAPGRVVGQAKSFVGSALGRAKAAAEGFPESVDAATGQAKSFVGSAFDKAKTAAEGFDLGDAKDQAKAGLNAATARAVDSLAGLADKARAGLKRVADGEEFFDPSTFAGKTEGALRQAVAEDGALRNNAVADWLKDLPEKYLTPEVREAAADLTNRANQAVIAKAKNAWEAAKSVGVRIDTLAREYNEGRKFKRGAAGPKKSAVYDTPDNTIVDAIAPAVARTLPEISRNDISRLAGPLRRTVHEMLSGEQLSAQSLLSLLDVTGQHTADLLDRVRATLKVTDKDELANFYKAAADVQDAQRAHEKLLAAISDSSVNGPVDVDTARRVARGIVDWVSTSRNQDTHAGAKFYESRFRAELERYFGDKVGEVLDAAEKLLPKADENMLEKARVKTDDEGNVLSHDGGDEGKLNDFVPDTKLNTLKTGKNNAGFLNPADDAGKGGYRPAVETALAKAQEEAPGARFARFGDELPLDHPAAQQRYKMLVSEADLYSQSDKSHPSYGMDPEAYAKQEIGKYGAIVHETSNNLLAVTANELAGAKLDAKAHSRSPSRLEPAGVGHALDAVKLTQMFRGRQKEEGGGTIVGSRLKDARAFMDGIAAVQDYTGKKVEIPDETVISKSGMTWGEAKKLQPYDESRVPRDPNTEDIRGTLAERDRLLEVKARVVDHLAAVRDRVNRHVQDAINAARDKRRYMKREEIIALRKSVEEKVGVAKMRKQLGDIDARLKEIDGTDDLSYYDDTNGTQLADPTGFEGGVGRGIDMRKKELNDAVRNVKSEIGRVGKLLDGEQQFGQGEAEVKLRKQLSILNTQLTELERTIAERTANTEDLGTGQREFDPFGPTFQNGRTLDEITPGGINTDGGEVRTPGVRAPTLLGRSRGPKDPPAPGAGPNRDQPHAEAVARMPGGSPEAKPEAADKSARQSAWLLDQLDNIDGFRKALKSASAEKIAAVFDRFEAMDRAGAFDHLDRDRVVKAHSVLEDAAERADEIRRQSPAFKQKVARGLSWLQDRMSDLDALRTEAEKLSPQRLEVLMEAASDESGFADRYEQGRVIDVLKEARTRQREGTPDPKVVAAKKAALVEKARSGDPELINDLKTSTDAKGLQRAAEALTGDDPNTRATVDAVNDRLRELVAAPDTAYGMQIKRYSLETPGRDTGPRNVEQAIDHIRKVLGDSVKIDAKANIPHVAEFERVINAKGGVEDVIRLSVRSMNPLSGAYHESVHAFFAKLGDQRNGEVAGILEKAASSPTVTMRLRELLKGQPEALKRLADPEERVAYMYQFHSMGHDLGLGQPAKTLFGRVMEFVRSALGVWSNDQRALHILDYFHSGKFKANLGDGRKVYNDLMAPGRNQAIETFKQMVRPISNLGEQLAVAGHQRLRDTGIPALRELADVVKRQGISEGEDQGFIPAARQERAIRMNRLGAALDGVGPEGLSAALEMLQNPTSDAINGLKTPDERLAARGAVRAIRAALDEAYDYMTEAGVGVFDLGVGRDYFPRVWDVSYISSHKDEFMGMLDKYVKSGQFKSDPKELLNRLTASEGNEFTIETDRPGMQFLKPRELAFIKGEDAAQFLNKNLYETLNGYMTQATRRAEWARRLSGEDGEGQKFGELMAKAEQQGATPADLDAARKYMRAVDGTLGDTISPEFRRVQGNIMVYQNMRLLPLAIFSSVVDPMGIVVRGGTVGEAFKAFKRGIAEIPKGFKKDAAHDEATQLAATLGVIDAAVLTHTLGTSFSQGMVGDTGRKVNDTIFKLNLMEQFNTSMRVAATEAAIGFLGRHAEGKGTHSERWLAELGFVPGEVQLDAKGRPLVTENDGLSPEQAAKMKTAINRWVDGAVLRPDAADRPVWMSDPHFSLISHLKQFTFSFQETILKRVAHEVSHGNLGPAFALASYVPIMIASDAIKGALQSGGGEPDWKKDWGVAEYVQSGIERGGLLGVGQFGADILKDVGRGGAGVGALAGPTLGQLGEAVSVIGGRREFAPFLLHSMPANALYAHAFKGEPAEARVAD